MPLLVVVGVAVQTMMISLPSNSPCQSWMESHWRLCLAS